MKVFRFVLLLSMLAALPLSQAIAQPTEQRAQAILSSGSDQTIENLVKLGGTSSTDAAAVIVVVAEKAPKLLEEVMQGLMVVLEPSAFRQAVIAASKRVKSPAVASLITDTARLVDTRGLSPGEGFQNTRDTDNSAYIEDGTPDETDPSASAA